MCSADTSQLSFPARFSQLWWINTSLSVLRHPRTHGTKNHYRKFFFFLSCSWLYPTLCDFLLIQRVNFHSGSVASFNTGKKYISTKKKKITRTHDGIQISHWPVWKCERKLLRDTVGDRIHSRQMCKSKSEKYETQMFRELAEIGCEIEC